MSIEEQLRYLNSIGFLMLVGLLTTAEVERLRQEYDARVAKIARLVPLGHETRDINGLVLPPVTFGVSGHPTMLTPAPLTR